MAQHAAKSAMRKAITQVVKDVQPESIHKQSQNVLQRLIQMPEYQRANRLGVYLSIENKEIQTKDIVVDAMNSGKHVFVPHIHKYEGGSQMDMLALESLEEYQSLPQDRWGIPSLPSDAVSDRENWYGGKGTVKAVNEERTDREDVGGLDLIVMPGLAFDRALNRLGHGRGYYDRFLKRYLETIQYQASKLMPPLVALALNEQLLPVHEAVPTSEDDWQIDIVVVGNGEVLSRG